MPPKGAVTRATQPRALGARVLSLQPSHVTTTCGRKHLKEATQNVGESAGQGLAKAWFLVSFSPPEGKRRPPHGRYHPQRPIITVIGLAVAVTSGHLGSPRITPGHATPSPLHPADLGHLWRGIDVGSTALLAKSCRLRHGLPRAAMAGRNAASGRAQVPISVRSCGVSRETQTTHKARNEIKRNSWQK